MTGIVLRQTDTMMPDGEARAGSQRGDRVRLVTRRIGCLEAVTTAVILPVKSFANAKQRLGERFGGPGERSWQQQWSRTS